MLYFIGLFLFLKNNTLCNVRTRTVHQNLFYWYFLRCWTKINCSDYVEFNWIIVFLKNNILCNARTKIFHETIFKRHIRIWFAIFFFCMMLLLRKKSWFFISPVIEQCAKKIWTIIFIRKIPMYSIRSKMLFLVTVSTYFWTD